MAEGLPPPGLYGIDADLPFLGTLADALVREGIERLADTTVLLPSRRACLAFQEILLERAGGGALLLPRIEPVGDLEEAELLLDAEREIGLPPAMSPLRRRLLLARLVAACEAMPDEQAIRLADSLAALLDEVQTEEAELARLADPVPEEFAAHWEKSGRFLAILDRAWPEILAAEDRLDPAERRRRVLDLQSERCCRRGMEGRVIAAGITGGIPAVARLLAALFRSGGWVVLAGFDRTMDAAMRARVAEDPSHPQYGLLRLLEVMETEPEAVRPWPRDGGPQAASARRLLWREVFRPAGSSEEWSRNPPFPRAALRGLSRLEARDPAEEAMAIAVRLRGLLADPDRRAILVTTDRQLARRVSAELQRWRIPVEDSAGVPLDQSPPGSFLLLCAHLLAEGPLPALLLAALKHPLAGGEASVALRARARRLERLLLRGPRPASDLRTLHRRLAGLPGEEAAELARWFAELVDAAAPFLGLAERDRAPLTALVDAHLGFSEWLAGGTGGALWSQEAGGVASRFFAELRKAAEGILDLAPAAYPGVLAVLMAGETVRPARPGHPRLRILGRLESRLQQADLVVLASLNEGEWPAPATGGPWLNRRMRERIGLPPAEQSVGLAALDFELAASAPEVLLTRARRDHADAPTVPSRWWQRMDAVLRAAGAAPEELEDRAIREWAARLDQPAKPPRPRERPQPRPPREARPRELWATDIGRLMRDPYGFYARKILALVPLPPLDAEPGAAERGSLVHRILHAFVHMHPETVPEDAAAKMTALAEELLRQYADHPEVVGLWLPRLRGLAGWFAERERERRPGIRRILVEEAGGWEFRTARGSFTLRARADRIEQDREGRLHIIDYKTGGLPKRKEVVRGLEPQLLVEGLIARGGGFGGLAGEVASLAYWRLAGDGRSDEEKVIADGTCAPQLLSRAACGLARLLEHFAAAETPYPPVPRPEVARRDDYDHLARRREWMEAAASGEAG